MKNTMQLQLECLESYVSKTWTLQKITVLSVPMRAYA